MIFFALASRASRLPNLLSAFHSFRTLCKSSEDMASSCFSVGTQFLTIASRFEAVKLDVAAFAGGGSASQPRRRFRRPSVAEGSSPESAGVASGLLFTGAADADAAAAPMVSPGARDRGPLGATTGVETTGRGGNAGVLEAASATGAVPTEAPDGTAPPPMLLAISKAACCAACRLRSAMAAATAGPQPLPTGPPPGACSG
mmetsp:Transcript_86404/g.193154  ORF Transcript_86404/g.193154 Transcript_86404/m.193154 type:complete len:201 (-) Transcript_86404:270-872(-)